ARRPAAGADVESLDGAGGAEADAGARNPQLLAGDVLHPGGAADHEIARATAHARLGPRPAPQPRLGCEALQRAGARRDPAVAEHRRIAEVLDRPARLGATVRCVRPQLYRG